MPSSTISSRGVFDATTSCNPNFHYTGANYLNSDATAFMELVKGNARRFYPRLEAQGRCAGLMDLTKVPAGLNALEAEKSLRVGIHHGTSRLAESYR